MAESLPKILYICDDLTQSGGGVRTSIELLTENLDGKFLTKKISLVGKEPQSTSDTIFLNQKKIFDETLISFDGLKRIRQEARASDIVHFNNLFTLSALALFLLIHFYNKRSVVTFRGMFYAKYGSFVKTILNVIRKLLIANFAVLFARKIVFLTEAQGSSWLKPCIFKKKLRSKKKVINNFISSRNILESGKKNEMGIVYVGRLSKFKGFQDLVNCIQATDDLPIKYSVIGKGNLESLLQNQHNVRYIGEVDNETVFTHYDINSILIFPSYAEGFGLVVIEAMARGLVILVSDIPGMREIVQEGRNGYFFKPGDTHKMEELVRYLVSEPAEIQRISDNNIKDVYKFTAENQVPKYVNVYEEVLNR